MKFHRKGQAALEFLTTYGWAFLVILVAIGGLSYFGVFDIGRVLPDGCKLENNIDCGDIFAIASDGTDATVDFEIRNGRDRAIEISGISIIEKSLGESTSPPATCIERYGAGAFTVSPGTFASVNMDSTAATLRNQAVCGIVDNIDQKKTFDVRINYTVVGSGVPLVSKGTITTTVISS